ncbi:MAG: hypothetical protein GWP10_13540 [Nitrospiraceae bacterium]|nr:hypothetical protein [Nitrospiraceae bacterium]
MELIIEYDPINGESVPDGEIKEWLKNKIDLASELESELNVVTSTSLIIEEARAMIHEHTLSSKDIVFKYKGEMLYSDEFGKLDYWPAGFCDTFEKILDRLI